MGPLSSLAILLTSLLLPAAATPISIAPAVAGQLLPNKYIITLKPGVGVSSIHTRLGRRAVGVEKVYDVPGFAGYSGEFDSTAIEEIMHDETVAAVEPVMVVTTQAISTQLGAPWGLGSISHRTANHTDYLYDNAAGQGTWAYVIDTGLYTEHEAFAGGKGVLGYNAYPNSDFVDRIGHGSHCAGTIASQKWGVAKNARVVSVKVFDTGSSSTDIVLDGYQWAVTDITSKGRKATSVISMSLSGGRSTAFNSIVAAAFDSGITTVVAAGNSFQDASNSSPASEPKAITVGAIDIDNIKPGFSNYGTLVDVFAPGVDVESAWIGATDATNIISGTSMATPHVAGLVLYAQSVLGLSSPAEIAEWIVQGSTKGVVVNRGSGSPDRLAFNGVSSST